MLGQVLGGQRFPALAVAGQPVQRQHPQRDRTGRSGAHAGVAHALNGASQAVTHRGRADLSDPRGVIPAMSYRWGRRSRRGARAPVCAGCVRVLGGAGTGKSSLLIDVAATRIRGGTDPESVLLLTGSGRISAQARSALTAKLLGTQNVGNRPAVIREPLVRSVHGYAFAVLRLAAQRTGDPPPRLITSAEQDGIIAERWPVISPTALDASVAWPAELRAALGTAGFAAELRELLTRCAERGVDPQQLERVGRLSGRREWAAAGRFAQHYEQVMLLRAAVGTAAPQATTPAVGAAELVGAALEAFAADPELLAAERARIGVLLVDDAQQLDPQAALLVRVLAAGAEAHAARW